MSLNKSELKLQIGLLELKQKDKDFWRGEEMISGKLKESPTCCL